MSLFISSHNTRMKLFATAVLTTLLAGCGGGGGDAAGTSTNAQNTLNPSATDGARVTAAAVAVSGTASPAGVIINDGTGYTSAEPAAPADVDYTTSAYTGTGYFIDSTLGNDANPGTQAQPWRTLSRAATTKLASGDALLLKCGEVWRESMELTTKYVSEGNLLVGAYGDCTGKRRPTIRASDWVSPSGWVRTTNSANPIYVQDYSRPVTRLLLDGKALTKARFPNYQGVGAEFAIAQTAGSRSSFFVSASDLPKLASQDLIGATVYLKVMQWKLETALIAAFDASTGKVTLDRNVTYSIPTGTGYILEGKQWMLDAPGEWHLDEAAKQLYLWGPNNVAPTDIKGLEASWRDYGLIVRWFKGLRVERLNIEQANIDGLLLVETPDATVSDVRVKFAQNIGISVLSSPNVVVQDSIVSSAGHSGIVVRESPSSRVLRNLVVDTGLSGQTPSSEAAIIVFGENILAEGNVVRRAASFGIRFSNRPGTVIRDNTVFSACTRFTDCAAIYTYTLAKDMPLPAALGSGSLVTGNFVMHVRSNQEGCGYACKNLGVGIYMDELTTGVVVNGNTITDVEVGIGLLNGKFNTVSNNIVRGAVFAALNGLQTRSDSSYFRGNRIEGNSFFVSRTMSMLPTGLPGESEAAYAMSWVHPTDPRVLFSGTNPNVVVNNTYVATYAEGPIPWRFRTLSSAGTYSGADWRTYAPTDVQARPILYRQYVATTDGASLIKNGGFTTLNPLSWVPYLDRAGSGTFSAANNTTVCGKACGRLLAGTSSDYLMSNTFNLNSTAGQNLYLVKYTAIGGSKDGQRRASIRRGESPWESFGYNQQAQPIAQGQKVNVADFFLASSNGAGVLDLRGGVGSEIYFTDVSLQQVKSVAFQDLSKLVSHVLNPSQAALSFTCASLKVSSCDMIDEAGSKVTWPVTIPARSSKTLYAKNPTWAL